MSTLERSLRILAPAAILGLLIACASADAEGRRIHAGDSRARPQRIQVEDYAFTLDGIDPDATVVGRLSPDALSPEAHALGQALTEALAVRLVDEILQLGLPAERAAGTPVPAPGALVIEGQFVHAEEGAAGERRRIGFGEGSAEVLTLTQVYVQGDDGGRRPLHELEVAAESSELPGLLSPMGSGAAGGYSALGAAAGAVAPVPWDSAAVDGLAALTARRIADDLSRFFSDQGWIPHDRVR